MRFDELWPCLSPTRKIRREIFFDQEADMMIVKVGKWGGALAAMDGVLADSLDRSLRPLSVRELVDDGRR